VYSGVWPLSYLHIFPLCFVSTGLICKACSLGLVHFTGETLSVSFQKLCGSDGSDLLRLGASQKDIIFFLYFFPNPNRGKKMSFYQFFLFFSFFLSILFS